MKSQNTKRSDQLKNEVQEELRHVRQDLDEITDSLSPGAILDRAIFRKHGGSLRKNFDHLKNNPIGTSFLTIGTILLMEDEHHHTYESHFKSKLSPSDYENWKSSASQLEPSTYMILGAGLGALTGASLPISDAEKHFVSEKMGQGLTQFETDLRTALNECSGILKDLILDDLKNYKVNVF